MRKIIYFLSCILLVAIHSSAQVPAATKEAFFKDWNYSPTTVFGLVKLEDTKEKSYYKLIKTDAQTTKIYSYNAAGIQTGFITIRFMNGKITQLARTDRWGDTYSVVKFTAVGPDQFILISKSSGRNNFLPCKSARYTYKNGLLSEVRYLDFNNKVCPNSDGVAIIRYKRYTDKNRYSLVNEIAYFDENNQPVISQGTDYHKIVYEYDERANQVLYAYYGTNNEPIINRFAAFKRKMEYDSHDRELRGTSYGINDEPAANTYNVAGTSYEYTNGFISKSVRYDKRFKVTRASDAGDGIAILKYSNDERGNEIKRSYYDENEQPINGQSGYHSISYTYDPLDMMTSQSFYDKYGSPIANRDNIQKYLYVRDDKGRMIQQATYDASNNPVKDLSDEVYMKKYKYDEQGRKVSDSYWQNSNTKMTRWNGYHEKITKYNEDGQETEFAYYDENGKLFTSSSGHSRVINVYGGNARLIERKYLNGNDGSQMTNSLINGFCSIKFSYDDKGRTAGIRYFDMSGNPVNATATLNKEDLVFHKVEFIYTGTRISEERLYLKDNNTPAKIIDCLKNDYISTSGVTMGYKNQ